MDEVTIATTIRSNLLAKLLDYSVNPRTSYTIEGQSVSYSDYLDMIMQGIKNANELITMFSPFEFRSTFG
jgi:hypothetical protein